MEFILLFVTLEIDIGSKCVVLKLLMAFQEKKSTNENIRACLTYFYIIFEKKLYKWFYFSVCLCNNVLLFLGKYIIFISIFKHERN